MARMLAKRTGEDWREEKALVCGYGRSSARKAGDGRLARKAGEEVWRGGLGHAKRRGHVACLPSKKCRLG